MSTQLAHKLRHIRKVELAYSESQMAEALGAGVTAREVRSYECGKGEPSLVTVENYATLIGISPAILLDDAREIRPNTGLW